MNFSKKIYAIILIVLSMLLTNLYAQSNPGKSIAADFSVSPTGALTYQVPFEVPSHVLGHFPNLGLGFNSQAGDGIAGYGWSITGLSSITRTSATKYHDGFIAPVDFTETDRFAIDGQRLMLKSGNYGKPGSTYETESYSNIKIEAVGTSRFGSDYGPSYFIVYHPNGLRYWYGLQSSTNGHSSSKLEWSLAKIEDTQGNQVVFKYTLNKDTLRLDSVNDPTAKISVHFSYGTKTEVNPIAMGGFFFNNNRLLNAVTIKLNGSYNYMKYNIVHESSSIYVKRIKEIQCENRLNEKLPPIKFKYFEPTTDVVEELRPARVPHQIGDIGAAAVVTGDFNNDENIDFVVFSTDRTGDKIKDLIYTESAGNGLAPFTQLLKPGEFENIFVSNYLDKQGKLSNRQALVIQKRLPNTNKVVFEINLVSRFSGGTFLDKQYTIDWNLPSLRDTTLGIGNNLAVTNTISPASANPKNYASRDITASNLITGTASVNYFAKNSIVFKPGFKAAEKSTFRGIIDEKLTRENPKMKYVSGDFDGDGFTDFIVLNSNPDITRKQECSGLEYGRPIDTCPEPAPINTKAFFVSLNPNLSSNNESIGQLRQKYYPEPGEGNRNDIFTGDYDGDGRTDLYHRVNKNVYIYSLDNDGKLVYRTQINNIYKADVMLPGDFNGDGKTDLMCSREDASKVWTFYISNGVNGHSYHEENTYIDYRNSISRPYSYRPLNGKSYKAESIIKYNYIPVDFDKDGKTDIIRHEVIAPRYENGNFDYSVQWLDYARNKSKSSHYLSFDVKRVTEKYNVGKPGKGHPIYADFYKGNLNSEYAYAHYDGNVDIYAYKKSHRQEVCIESIENNGLEQSFEYDGMTPLPFTGVPFSASTYSDFFSKDYTYPFVEIEKAKDFKLVKKVTQKFSGHTRTKRFLYAGLVSSANGLGLLGFNYMASSSWEADDMNTFWTVNAYKPEKRGLLDKTWTLNYTPSSLSFPSSNFVSKATYEYEKRSQPNGVFAYLPNKITNTNGLTGVTSTTFNTYDAYNNITQSRQNYSGGSKVVSTSYYNNPSGTGVNYYIGRPKTKKETTTLGSESFSTEEAYTYSNNFIQTLKTKGNNTAWLTETFTHDRFGNITSKTLSAPGMVNRTEKSKYDTATGRFMIEATDIQGLVTKYRYHTSLGHLLEETDPFGKKQKFAYDGWNRLTKQTDYLNNTISTSYLGTADGGVQVSTTSSLGGGSKVITNRLGWEIKNSTRNVLNQWVSKEVVYDAEGKVTKESQPFFGTSASQWSYNYYDDYNRPMQQKMYNGLIVNTAYDGLKVTVDDGTKTVSKTQDAVGNTISMTDPGGTINYTYYANNTPKETVYGTHKITTKIDGWGRKTELNDPAAGIYTYSYNILGELLSETTPNGTTTYQLDNWGRPIVKNIQGSETNMELKYAYDGTHKQIKQITARDNFNQKDYKYNYTYDNYQRLVQQYEVNPEFGFSTRYTFDSKGRLEKEYRFSNKDGSYGPNFSVNIHNHYHPQSGQLYKITGNNSQNTLWEIKQTNQRGQLTQIGLGNGLTKFNDYDSYGLPRSIRASTTSQQISGYNHVSGEYYYSTRESDKKVELSLKFDAQRGNLLSRHNKSANVGAESFTYDSQDRLTDIAINGATSTTQSYQPNGNIATNPQVGTYNYDPKTMYRVMGIDLNPLGKSHYEKHTPQNITYNAYKKPVSIHEQNNGRVNFEYGPLMNRSIAYYGGNSTSTAQRDYKKVYAAITPSEVIIDQKTNQRKYLTYIGGDAYTAPIAYVRQPSSMGESGFMYLHRDHLGSIIAITNSDGEVIEKTHYSAWGEVAEYWDAKGNDTLGYTSILGRGYTGHEHFNSVSLIHMNGRMYDAKLRRFLSPDNFIQDPFNTQSFNRYGYVWNNPLKYNDPSGEFLVTALIIGAVAGAYFGGVQANGSFNPLKWELNANTIIGVFGGALVGAVSGVVAAVATPAILTAASISIPGGILGGAISGAFGGLIGGAISGFGTALLPGGSGKPLEGLWKGAVTGLIGGALIGGVIGGTQAAIKGNNIWNGKEITKAVTSASTSKANSIKAASESLDETLNTKTSSSSISENNGITKAAKTPAPNVNAEDVVPDAINHANKNLSTSKTDLNKNLKEFFHKGNSSHTFRNASGHLDPKTFESKLRAAKLFQSVISDPSSIPTIKVHPNGFTTTFYNKFFNNGSVWVETVGGKIKNAGVNYYTP